MIRISERKLRRIIREMALKGINIARAQKMDDTEAAGVYRSPDESGVFPPVYYPNFNLIQYPELSAEDMYQASSNLGKGSL